jgi:hypothetical protein
MELPALALFYTAVFLNGTKQRSTRVFFMKIILLRLDVVAQARQVYVDTSKLLLPAPGGVYGSISR